MKGYSEYMEDSFGGRKPIRVPKLDPQSGDLMTIGKQVYVITKVIHATIFAKPTSGGDEIEIKFFKDATNLL